MVTWLSPALGVVCLVAALADLFLTVLHIEAESPLTSTLHRALWWLLRSLIWLLPRRAQGRVLSWGAPLMVASTLVFWALLFVVGFGLLYLPLIHDVRYMRVDDGARTTALGDALYYSGVSFFTIGYGDLAATHPLARLLSVLEAGAGLLIISMAVAYLLTIYPPITRQMALAVSLNQQTAGRPEASVMASRYLAAGRDEALCERLGTLNEELLNLAELHGFYPVLHYVRPVDVLVSFVRILALVQGVIATLRFGLDGGKHGAITGDPRLAELEEGLLYTLHALASSKHLGGVGRADEGAEAALRDDFRALCELVRERGLAPSPAAGAAADGYVRFRRATDPYLEACCRRMGYSLSEARAVYGRWRRGSSLEGASPTAPGASSESGRERAE